MNSISPARLLFPVLTLVACEEAPMTEANPVAPAADAGDCTVGIDEGDCAPDFTLPSADGASVTLSDRLGERVVVVGSSLWCSRCRGLIQELAEWYDQADDVTVLNVIVQGVTSEPGTVQDAMAWRDQFDLPFDVLADSDETWADAWGDPSTRTYTQHSYTVLDREGRVAWHDFGEDGDVVPTIAETVDAIQ